MPEPMDKKIRFDSGGYAPCVFGAWLGNLLGLI
jgi:hypothetical protein